ncbi:MULTISPECIES: hypothetical protein [Pseudoalteromonas]|uniref:hypothetical protein n=1 Tax=Pseudoalteromonas TaxID=53246 RepID=UPI000C3395F0|nr:MULTISPECIES: hypothetical protein [Pseudoalteromonas]PKG64721.1 hypothetical protein CXF75_10805 [Pseudoalteromonas arctica]PKG71828.1 hypothetical protein CXF64_04430 [Pseudoalteromonas sp. GutCa3]
MESFKELYEELITQSKGNCVDIVEYDSCPVDKALLFEEFKIQCDNVYKFTNTRENKSEHQSESEQSNFAGYTLFYSVSQKSKALIVIKDIITDEHEQLNFAWKYLSLIHEIGHFKDFKLKKHINTDKLITDHLQSEIFAETYVLTFLKKYNDQLNKYAISLYCNRLLDWNSGESSFKFKVSQALINKFTRKRIVKWAKT